jgi:hypothetical protein
MYTIQDGKIGVSQFTPSAKRVYNKSNYFNSLKNNEGYKFVYRSNLSIVLPLANKRFLEIKNLLNFSDSFINIFINIKLKIHSLIVKKRINDISIEYINYIDDELEDYVNKKNSKHLSKKGNQFFSWLKNYNWVQEAPLIEIVKTEKYEFSMSAKKFNIYFIKILKQEKIIGFIILQRKDSLLKVLFAYYDDSEAIANLLLLHIIKLQIKQVVCYDKNINNELLKLKGYLYKRKKVKESIISKSFGNINFDDYVLNYGDGDCCFA